MDASLCVAPFLALPPGGGWDKARFDQIVNGLTPFLRSCGYNMKKEARRELAWRDLDSDDSRNACLGCMCVVVTCVVWRVSCAR